MRRFRVLRGGSYYDDSRFLLTSVRDWFEPGGRYWDNGFRIVVIRKKP